MSDNSDYTYFDTVYFDIKDFLAEYEKVPCLWDKNHEHFRDRRVRVKAEEDLGEKLGILDRMTLRRKIRSVRGTYNTEIRKVRQSLDCGGELYTPKLSWFSLADKFLRVTTDIPFDLHIPQGESEVVYIPKKKMLQKLPKRAGVTVVMVRPSHSRLQNWQDDEFDNKEENEETIEEDFELNEEVLELDEDEMDLRNFSHEENNSLNGDHSDEHKELLIDQNDDTYCDSSNFSPARKKTKVTKIRQEPTDTTLADVVKSLKDLQQASDNEFAAFGRSIGIQLQNMPLEIAVQLQTDIQAHITRTRLDYLKRKKLTSD